MNAIRPDSHARRQSPDFGGNRRCSACGTPLSRYNPGPNCYAHEARALPSAVHLGGPQASIRRRDCYPSQNIHRPGCAHLGATS